MSKRTYELRNDQGTGELQKTAEMTSREAVGRNKKFSCTCGLRWVVQPDLTDEQIAAMADESIEHMQHAAYLCR